MSVRNRLFQFVVFALVLGTAWGVMIPPFEAPDESFHYKTIVAWRDASRGGPPLYQTLMSAALKLVGTPTNVLDGRYNPAFRFVSNQRGRVNMFLHGRLEAASRGDIWRSSWLRLLTAGIWLCALLLVYGTARMFFGQRDLALLTAGLCLSLPGISFFASRLHQESTAALVASLAFWTIAAHVTGRIGRTTLWVLAVVVLGLAPLTDHQGYFLIGFVPFAIVATEPTWTRKAIAFGAFLALAVAGMSVTGTLQRDLLIWFAPFLPGYRYGWWTPDMSRHLWTEFAPKMFFGFVGWLGQPSVLLPPGVYAAAAAAAILAAAGIAMRQGPSLSRDQRKLGWLLAAGAVLAFAPILYTNILIDRTVHGRWMYPAVGPIMIGVVHGWRAFIAAVRRWPHRLTLGMAAAAGGLGAVWLSAYGDAIRQVIVGNHYGDSPHMIRAIGQTIALLGGGAVVVEAANWLSSRAGSRLSAAPLVLAVAGAANMVLLFGFVAPLYRELDDRGLAELVTEDAAREDYPRAASLYRLAIAEYPESTSLRQVARDVPLVFLRGNDDQLLGELRDRIGRGERLRTRAELMALARIVPVKPWLTADLLRLVVDAIVPSADTREPLSLLRAEIAGLDRVEAAGVIRAGGGVVVEGAKPEMHGQAMLEGHTVYASTGYDEVTVYFRPLREWAGRRLWMHVYPGEGPDYLLAAPAVPPRDDWKPNELAWETFRLPTGGPVVLYIGVELSHDLGPAYHLGRFDGMLGGSFR